MAIGKLPHWWLLVAASLLLLLTVVALWAIRPDMERAAAPPAPREPTVGGHPLGEPPIRVDEFPDAAAADLSGGSELPITIAVYLGAPSEHGVREWIPGSYLIRGDYESIEPWEPLPARTAAFVDQALRLIRERHGEKEELEAPFTEPQISGLVEDALEVDAEAGTGTARILATTAVALTLNLPTALEEPDTAKAQQVYPLLNNLCASLAHDEERLVPGVFSEYVRWCGLSQVKDLERRTATMPVAPEAYLFWMKALPSDGVVESDLHRRAIVATAQLNCEGCSGPDGEDDAGVPLDSHELALREAVRSCAMDLGLGPGVRDLRVPSDALRTCVEESGFVEAARMVVLLMTPDGPGEPVFVVEP